jgi:nicotinamidase-related amidase
MPSALLLMDYQRGICEPGSTLGGPSGLAAEIARRGVLDNAAALLRTARSAGVTVVHVRVAFDEHHTMRTNRTQRFDRYQTDHLLALGTPDAEFCADVAPEPGEIVITKGCVGAFTGTALGELLTGRGIREVYLGGVATHMVVESTARHAADSGYAVRVVEDLCASHSAEPHDYAIRTTLPAFAEITDSGAVAATFEKAV